jgi:cytochrome P450
MTVRKVVCDGFELSTTLGNTYKFRKGDTIVLFPAVTHYDDNLFPDASKFKYDRFIDPPLSIAKNGQNIPFNYCFMPFGGGTSWCPGRKFARNEIKTIVAFLIYTFDFSFQDASINTAKWAFDTSRVGLGVFHPKESVRLTFQKKMKN